MVQTVEISRSAEASAQRVPATLGWFAGCSQARLQLLNAYRVRGLGEEAQMLKLRIPNDVRRTYVVGLARTGSLTVSTVSETLGGSPVAVDRAVNTLTEAVRNVCASDPSGPCPSGVTRGAGAAAALGRDPWHPRGRRPPGDREDQQAVGRHPAGAGAAQHRGHDLRQGRTSPAPAPRARRRAPS